MFLTVTFSKKQTGDTNDITQIFYFMIRVL